MGKKRLVRIVCIAICAIFVLAVIIPLMLYIFNPHSEAAPPYSGTVTTVYQS